MSLANAVEEQLLNGDGVAPNINGLLQRLADPDEAMEKYSLPYPMSRQLQVPWMASTDTLSTISALSRVNKPIRRWSPVISSRLRSR